MGTITSLIEEIDAMCIEFEHEGKNATQAIADKDYDAMYELAEFFALDDEELIQFTYNELKKEANK